MRENMKAFWSRCRKIMNDKMNHLWSRYKELPFQLFGGIMLVIFAVLACFGYYNDQLIIATIVIATIAGICYFLAIKQESEKRWNLGFTSNHFCMILAIIDVGINAAVYFS